MEYDIFAKLMEARIDIKNKGSDENDIILSDISDGKCIVTRPAWFRNEGIGYSLKSIVGRIKFTVTFIKDGTLNLFLHTEPSFSLDGKNSKFPIWLDYVFLSIDGTPVFSDRKATWHDKYFVLDRTVKDGEKITVEIAWQPHIAEAAVFENMLDHLHEARMSKIIYPLDRQQNPLHKTINPTDVSFSIFGICVSRDIVNMLGSRVNRFVQDVSPISVCYESPLPDGFRLTEGNIGKYLRNPKLNHFHVRNTILDMNKDVYSYLFDVKSDWIVLDTGCLRYRTLINRTRGVGVTECHPRRLDYKYNEKEFELISVSDMSENAFEKCMDQYIDGVLYAYEEKNIIVVETYMVSEYVDSTRDNINEFGEDIKKRNEEIRRGYDYLKRKLKNAHFVPFLNNTIGDENNKWGKASLHYVQEYYGYGSEAIKVIMAMLPMSEEKKRIERLKKHYQERIRFEYLLCGEE